MAVQSSGEISIQDIVDEFGGTAPHSLSEYYGSDSVPSSGEISISDFYGTSNCYTAGTATTLYSHSSGLGVGGVGENFYRTLEEYTAPKCGTYNLSGSASAGYTYSTKRVHVILAVNGTQFHSIHDTGFVGGARWSGSFNHNMTNSVTAGDAIQLRGYLWGGYGQDRFDSSSLTVKVA
jgi:hypothetical protein